MADLSTLSREQKIELAKQKMSQSSPPENNLDLSSMTREQKIELAKQKMQSGEPQMQAGEAAKLGAQQGIPVVGPYSDEVRAAYEALTGNKSYRDALSEIRQEYKKAEKDQPAAYNAALMAPNLALAPIKAIPVAGTVASGVMGAIEGAGASEETDPLKIARDAAISGGVSAVTAGLGNKFAPYVTEKISGMSSKIGKKAEDLFLKATGATAKQADKFEKDAAKELANRGLIKAGDTPGDVANRLEKKMEESGKKIGSTLKELDTKGVTVNKKDIIKSLRDKAKSLKGDDSQYDKMLQLNTLADQMERSGRKGSLTLTEAETRKRNYLSGMKNSKFDPEKFTKNEEAYLAYRDAVEEAATKKYPSLAKIFKEEKDTYGLLAPIKKASSARNATLRQSPYGGLLDVASLGAGAAYGGSDGSMSDAGLYALLAAGGRRYAGPRMASTSAVVLNKISKALKNNAMAFGKYSNVLLQASQRGGNALREADAAIREIDPEYKKQVEELK